MLTGMLQKEGVPAAHIGDVLVSGTKGGKRILVDR
jgi:hypothetical protein